MLYKFLEINKYTILGDSIEIYKIDVYETSTEDEYSTQVQIKINILKMASFIWIKDAICLQTENY